MDTPSLRRTATAAAIIGGGLLWLAAILFMAQTAQHSAQFSRLHPWILMINVAGLVVLVGLLATKLAQLVRDWRGHVIGSRLKARMVWTFGVLATLPILLVYFFAVQFLNKGIDSWFNVEMRQSLDDALVLSRSALETRMREHLAATEVIADELAAVGGEPSGLLETLRRQAGALEITVATDNGRIIVVSKGLSSEVVPDEVPGEVLLQVRQGRPFVSLEPQAAGGYLVRTAVPLGGAGDPRGRLVVQALYPVAERIAALADTLQATYQQFGEKDYLRRPLKASFILTLTVVLLLSLLAAWYGAIFTAQRLVQPIQDLVKGTRAVAQGDLDTRLPLHVARRDGLPRALVQRHDQAAAGGARGPAARAAGGGDGAREPRDHPRPPVHGRDLARAGPARAHREPRRDHHPRRRSRRLRRPAISA